MTRKKTLQQMNDVLLQRRDALRQAIAGDDSLLKSFGRQSGGDVVDFATESSSGELNSQLSEVEHRELKYVSAALQRMKNGEYGKCEGCKQNIPLARLKALPYACFCIKCKRAAEEAGVEPDSIVDWSLILNSDLSSTDLDFNFS